jgi:hypothetical protein
VSALEEQQRIHEHNLSELASQPVSAPQTIKHPTGETLEQVWQRLDWNGRNDLMRQRGIRRLVRKEADGFITVTKAPDAATFEGEDYYGTVHALTHPR